MNCPNAKAHKGTLYCQTHECVACGAERQVDDACGPCCKFKGAYTRDYYCKFVSLIGLQMVYLLEQDIIPIVYVLHMGGHNVLYLDSLVGLSVTMLYLE